MHKVSIYLGALGGIIILIAVIIGDVIFPSSITNRIKKERRLLKGTPTWRNWFELESPVYLNFYIFNVTNPDDVELGQSPVLEEVGPYVYWEKQQKFNPVTESCKETVEYEEKITYMFDAEKSGNRSEEDLVNVVNMPFIVCNSEHKVLIKHVIN